MSKAPACQICDAAARRPYAAHAGYTLHECAVCGFVALDPLPDAAARVALYDDAYGGASTGYFAKVDKKTRRARRRAAFIARKVRGGPAQRRFLDVGSSAGFMVEAARKKGFEGVGVELDGTSIAYAREHYPENTFFRGTVEDYAHEAAGMVFDAVYCSEVIEHTADANSFMAAIARLTRTGGILYLTTPDIGHRRRPRDLAAWDAFCPPSHCLYFTEGSLRLLLKKHGFQDVRRRFAWKPGLKVLARKT